MKYAAKTDVGHRSGNEDACHIPKTAEENALVIVSDGMGGHNAGEVASSLVITGMLEEMQNLRRDDLAHQLSTAVMNVNLDVYRAAEDDGNLSGMGATLVCALLEDARYLCANVGDSRLYQFSDGALRQITRDHSYVQMLVDCGDITPEEARTHPRRNLIMRAMGADARVSVDLFDNAWKAGDLLLLCSDGLSGPVPDEEIAEILRAGGATEETCAALIRRALDNGGTDNITVVLAANGGGVSE